VNERVKRLRQESLDAIPTISMERASLLTDFYRGGVPDRVSVPIARALAFNHLLEHKAICISEGELIVGERGPAPKATPTYPEICTHSVQDFDILDSREKIPFRVTAEDRDRQKNDIGPFWQGRSVRDRIFEAVDPEWIEAYEAGVFTEFQEQRAPGHTVLDDKIYHSGLADFRDRINDSMEALDFLHDPTALDRREELQGMQITVDALIMYARRHADRLRELASAEADPDRRSELEQMADICTCVPENRP